jgi:two-component system, OmpR family, phosphate regulon sensor histidine kinase PhoR
MKNTLFLKIFGGFCLIIAAAAAAILLFSFTAIRSAYLDDQAAHLGNLAEVIKPTIASSLKQGGEPDALALVVEDVARKARIRITVVDAAGAVLADSEGNPNRMESHQYRPEVFQSLQGQPARAVRRSSTVKADMLYMSFPLTEGGKILGALRLSRFMKDIDGLLAHLKRRIIGTALVVMALVFLAMLLFSRSISEPVREFVAASRKVAGGDFEANVSLRHKGEFADFARSFNAMTSDLKSTFAICEERREELDSILASTQDGLLVIDRDDRIILINEKFRSVVADAAAEGRYYWEVIRGTRFTELVRRVKEGRTKASDEVVLKDRAFLCGAAFLPSRERVVVTIHDLSEIRDAERMKKDLVLNASHELRTPLTAIKGFVEALEERAQGEDKGYLEIIGRNTDRMIGIVQDLMTLAEMEDGGGRLESSMVDMKALAGSVLSLFGAKAEAKGVHLELTAAAPLPRVRGDAFRLEQMLVNLVDNALKATEKGSVTLSLSVSGGDFLVEVRDTGIGIPEEHLPHVFERFYVVDKSRSRKQGGTGLGLSIVKHVVKAHGGRVGVSSRPGEGSTFTVALPAGKP